MTARTLPIGSMVTVRGVVTAEAGRLGTPSLLAIGDASGGIVVKLPSGVAPPARGRILEVHGPLADPYGQLEVRPATAADVTVDDVGALSAPLELSANGPDETTEGRLVRIDGVVVARPTKATSGDIALTIETSNGTRVRLLADVSSGVPTSTFDLHARYRVTGISGQRASKKGAPDGYRIWLRDPADVLLLAAAPASPTPSPSAGSSQKPKSSPSPTDGTPATIGIAAALKVTDRDVAIEAVVTAPVTLLDSSGRRIVVQDTSGAIEVLLPKDTRAPSMGAKVRAVGRIGKAYGAPRLRAESIETRGSSSVPAPLRVSGPLTGAHTWRLVSVAGRIDSVRKLGERWRAEVVVGSSRLVVVGQPGSGIPSSALAEGRTAEIIGIVRPAYPSATDRRASVLPRWAGDIKLGPGTGVASTPGGGGATNGSSTSGASSPGVDPAVAAAYAAVPDADLADLESHVDATVRVGGLVVALQPSGFTLDDGTAVGQVLLSGEAEAFQGLIEPEDAINVVGRVTRQEGGTIAIVVDDPAAIWLGSGLGATAASPSAGATPAGSAAPADMRIAGFGGDSTWFPGAGVGLVGLVGISLASVAVTILRRRQIRRLMAGRIAARLAAIATPSTPREDPAGP